MYSEGVVAVLFTVYGLGAVGNVISIAVWSSLVCSLKGALLMMLLSVSDLLAIASGVAMAPSSSQCFSTLLFFVQDVFFYFSTYITLVIVVQRYVSVAFPHRASSLFTKARQLLVVAVMFVVSLVQCSGTLKLNIDWYNLCMDKLRLDLMQSDGESLPSGNNMSRVNVTSEPYATKNYGVEYATGMQHLMDAYEDFKAFEKTCQIVQTCLNLLPAVLLIVFNVLLMREMRNASMVSRRPSVSSTTSATRRNRAALQLSVVALWAAFTSILVYAVVVGVGFYIISAYDDPNSADTLAILTPLRDIPVAIAVSINFVFYSVFCQSFRGVLARKWRQLTGRVTAVTCHGGNRPSRSHSQSSSRRTGSSSEIPTVYSGTQKESSSQL